MKNESDISQREIAERVLVGIKEAYISEAVDYKNNSSKVILFRYLRNAAAVLLAVTVLGFTGVSVAAASGYMPAIDILSKLYPELSRKISPLNVSCVDNGIEMKVAGVYVEDNIANVYISMQDLTGDRIDETIDLFDSYSIHTNVSQVGHCQFVEYDSESKTAYFLIEVQHEKDKPITDKYMTFSVGCFLSHKMTTESNLPEINLNEIPLNSEISDGADEKLTYRGGSNTEDKYILKLNEMQKFSPVEGVQITAWGFVDGKFNIQAYYEDIMNLDNHGWICLKNMEKEDEYVYPESNCFFDAERVGSYQRYEFDLGPDTDWSKYSLEAEFCTCTTLTRGNWKVSFPIESMQTN